MPDAFWAALAEPGLPYLAAVAALAGAVYGFAGFGSALIFLPLAAAVLPPAVAIGAFSVSAVSALVTVVPKAWRVADRATVTVMLAACIAATPLGVLVLRIAPEAAIRTALSLGVLATLAALIAGWRVPLRAGRGTQAGIGVLSGLAGGATGLNGPPVILFNLGTVQAVAVTRANLVCFLTLASLSLLPQLWLQGLLPARALWLGLLLFLPYAVGTALGSLFFDPGRAGFYRALAYVLIGAAGLAGLPLWE